MEPWQIIRSIGRGVIRRRKGVALLTFVVAALILLPLAYYLSKSPPRYVTSATILLETQPGHVPLFQEFSPVRPLPVQLAILYSRSLAEGVLERLPRGSFQDLLENPYYVDYAFEIKNAYRRLMGIEPEVRGGDERAVNELMNGRVRFEPNQYGIVRISAGASKPEVALGIVNSYIEALLARTRSFNIDDARLSREFLEQHVADVRQGLRAKEEALRSFTIEHGGITIPEQNQVTVGRLYQVENTLADVEANRKLAEARLKGLREKLESEKSAPVETAAPPPRPTPPSVLRLREQLTKLEMTLLDYETQYTEQHPRVIRLKDRLAELQQQLAAAVKETAPTTPAAGAVPPSERANFAEQVVALETSVHALSAQEDALRQQAQGLRRNLGGLSKGEVEYSRLVRDVDSNRNLYALLTERLTAARIREQGNMKVVKVIDPPGPPASATTDKRMKFGGLALLLAVALGGGVPVESEEDVANSTGLNVLAVIPHLRSERPRFLSERQVTEIGDDRRLRENLLFSESFRNLRVAVELAMRADGLRTLVVASPFPDEGKSTVLVNLGLAFREAGRRVVLADTDFLRPTLHHALGVPQTAGGLVDALHTKRSIEQSLAPVGEGLWLVPRGMAIQPQTRGLLATTRLKELIEEMADKADLVLCDSSPVLLMSDNLFLASAVDGVILVAKTGKTGCRDLARAKSLLEEVGAKILGVVINDMPASALNGQYRRYYRAYVVKDGAA